ncbi:MAG TPA: AraC family transcriptional regulator [Chitinophagaceae bacterium]|nr:AraC family transcriptional regulator [Chitinophagaceae bacterium]
MKKLSNKIKISSTTELIDGFLQHNELKILTGSSQDLTALHKSVYKKFQIPHKSDRYFFVFNEQNSAKHSLDLLEIDLSSGELLFVVPNQIHTSPPLKRGLKFYSLSFEANCLSLLPRQFYFLTNPFNKQIISFDTESRLRVKTLFETLRQLLFSASTRNNTEIILAHLNTLLSEFNNAYFKNSNLEIFSGNKLSKYIQFKLLIETEFKKQPSINSIAKKLILSENQLFSIVKEFSELSPKKYLIQRLMLEAQRILFYEKPSVKELAYELGFADPDYFSRLFKKQTGKSISRFVSYIQDLSSQK